MAFACSEKSLACQTPTAEDTAQLGLHTMVSAIVMCLSKMEKDSLVSDRMGVGIVMLNHSLQCPCQLENVYRNLLAHVQALQLRSSLTQVEARSKVKVLPLAGIEQCQLTKHWHDRPISRLYWQIPEQSELIALSIATQFATIRAK